MENKSKTIFLIYELGHVEELQRFFAENPKEKIDSLVIALSLDIEAKLREQKIPFTSISKYKEVFPNQLQEEDEMITAFFTDPQWGGFQYKNIFLPTIFQFMFRAYLQRVYYYSNLLISVMEKHPDALEFKLFTPSETISKTFGTLAFREINVVIDCAKNIASTRGMVVTVIPLFKTLVVMRNSMRPLIFSFKRITFGLFLKIWNMAIIMFRQPGHPRLLISDHWRNLKSSIELLKKAECIFLDRTEILDINWRVLIRHRMRFVHTENFLSSQTRNLVKIETQKFGKLWNDVRDKISPVFFWRGYTFDNLLLNAVHDIVGGFEKILSEIEGTQALYEQLRPQVVLLRASVSAQIHFSVLPLVAKNFGIPSLELQHGIEYLGPGSWSRDHVAEYIATYGSIVKRELLSIEYDSERIREIGSPRFDNYVLDHKDKKILPQDKFTVLCIAPDIRPFEIYDSYSAENYFSSVAKAVKSLKTAHVLIKLRPGPADEALLRVIVERVFSDIPHRIVQYEPLSHLYQQADAVVSCFSTAILEALQFGMPVVIPALNPVDAQVVNFHFLPYKQAGALFIVLTEAEFSLILKELASHPEKRNEIRQKIQMFISENFLFDGHSRERYADLILELTKRSIKT
ncbi:MAG: CDP-glycerol glycerophosphotransferase family protein [Patescibacteria group bacterium]